MPLVVPITEEMVERLAPDTATWKRAGELLAQDRIGNPGISGDGTWLLADGVGSAAQPFQLSADFSDPSNPILRSNSPSRKSPDHYSLALVLAYARRPETFGTREPSDDLIIKREKKVAADERKKFGPAAPKRTSAAKISKQESARRDALESLDRLLYDLCAGGKWFDDAHLEKIERTAKQLGDAQLPAAHFAARRLMLVGKQKGIGEDDRTTLAAEYMARTWAVGRRTQALLNGETGDDSAETVALLREKLLAEPAHEVETREGLNLFEAAYERIDDDARQQRLEISNLVDLRTGEVFQAIAQRAYKGLNLIPEQPSYLTPIQVGKASVLAGFGNRRLTWDKSSEFPSRESPESLEQVYSAAKADWSAEIDAFRKQLEHPLACRERVVLLKGAVIGRIGERTTVLENDSGIRIEALDRRKDYSNVFNLIRAAAMVGKDSPAVLVRFYVAPTTAKLVALPLAVFTAKQHLRLGI